MEPVVEERVNKSNQVEAFISDESSQDNLDDPDIIISKNKKRNLEMMGVLFDTPSTSSTSSTSSATSNENNTSSVSYDSEKSLSSSENEIFLEANDNDFLEEEECDFV